MKIKNTDLLNYAKENGFIYPGSEIYNGLANSWDFGVLGVEIIRNLKNIWWKYFIHQNVNNVGIDSSIFLNSLVWEASGHVENFTDPLIDCKKCKCRFRADNLIEKYVPDILVDNLSYEEIDNIFEKYNIKCPKCNNTSFTKTREFNLMFKTQSSLTNKKSEILYLRPETAQGIFINFKNILRSTRKKLPIGIGQIGKAFRNEITPGNMVFRTKEFEQMELEFFCLPHEDEYWFNFWVDFVWNFLLALGVNKENIRKKIHKKEELSHYSKATIDIEYNFTFGYGELWGIANRTDYDLKKHMEKSNKNLFYLDPKTGQKILPYCIEPSVGVGRLFLALLTDALYVQEDEKGKKRYILKINPILAPYKVCILPLTKKLEPKAKEVFELAIHEVNACFESSGSIGRRYYNQDAIGTKYCITIDHTTLIDDTVTVRDRDTMCQKRININNMCQFLKYNFKNELKFDNE